MMNSAITVYYLGPQGSFTHSAAVEAVTQFNSLHQLEAIFEFVPCETSAQVYEAAEQGRGWAVVALENNVEGYVIPHLDAVQEATRTVGAYRISKTVEFDAFIRPDHGKLTEVTAHPHGLAQCSQFIADTGLAVRAARSNAQACAEIQPHQVALASRECGQLYGLDTYKTAVHDFGGAHTDFLLIIPRDLAYDLYRRRVSEAVCSIEQWESIISVVPFDTGSGVVANVLDVFRDAGVNLTSLMSRPIKAVDGAYSFIMTIDAAPWEDNVTAVCDGLLASGTWLKTLAVYPRPERQTVPVDEWTLPAGGVSSRDAAHSGVHDDGAHQLLQ